MTKISSLLTAILLVFLVTACSAKKPLEGEFFADIRTMPGGAFLVKHLKISFMFQDGKLFMKAVSGSNTRTSELAYTFKGKLVTITNPREAGKKIVMTLEGNTLKCKECTPGFPTIWTKK